MTSIERSNTGVGLLLVDIQYDFIDGSLAVSGAEEILPVVRRLIDKFPYDILLASQDFHPPGHVSFASSHRDGPGVFKNFNIPHPIPQRAAKGETVLQMMWPDHCVQGTRGAKIEQSIHKAMEDQRKKGVPVHIVQKGTELNVDGYSAFADNQYLSFTELSRILYGGGTDPVNHSEINTLIVVGLATDYCVSSSAIDSKKFHFRTIVLGDAVRGVAKETTESAIEEMKEWGIEYVQTEGELYSLLNIPK